jgi:hypothetical protein
MISRLLLILAAVYSASAQQPIDESLVTRPSENIDFPGCWSDLAKADRNGDGFVKQNEYLNFIQEYGKRICFSTDALTLQQSATFNTLACICRSEERSAVDCCIGDNAQIPIAGAMDEKRTPRQKNYLTSVCKLTDATIDGRCPPSKQERAIPPGALVAVPATSGGLSDGAMWGIIAAAALLALLLCCCCCVLRRQKMKQLEEEEEENAVTSTAKNMPPMEQAPVVPPGPHLLRKTNRDPENGLARDLPGEGGADNPLGPASGASGATEADDSDEDEEGRKRRGGGNLPPGDEETGLRIPTAPRIPPPDDPANPPRNLRPIPPKEEEDDEWDQPGRNIEFPKNKDDMSAGEVDHYEPDGGVYMPERQGKEPLNWKKDWNRPKPEEPDEVDDRKHRIQSGLGEGEVWDKLDQDETEVSKPLPQGDVFDWVVQSALGVLDNAEQVDDDRLTYDMA